MKHFQIYELVDQKTYESMKERAWDLFSPYALQALDDFEDFFNEPVMVNNWHTEGIEQWRGWRTPEIAIALGSPNSEHKNGEAFDCTIHGILAEDAREKILANKDHPLLAKIMRLEGDVSWVHFDIKQVSDRIKVFHK